MNGDMIEGEIEILGYLAQAYTTMCLFINSLMVHYPAVTSQCSTYTSSDCQWSWKACF